MTLRIDEIARIERRNQFSLGRIERSHVIAVVAAVGRCDAIKHVSRASEKLRTKMIRLARLPIRELRRDATVGGDPFEAARRSRKHNRVVWTPCATALARGLRQVHWLRQPIA